MLNTNHTMYNIEVMAPLGASSIYLINPTYKNKTKKLNERNCYVRVRECELELDIRAVPCCAWGILNETEKNNEMKKKGKQ